MSRCLKAALALAMIGGAAQAEVFGLGREALPEEIAAWDLDVHPDGTGLPPGSGDVMTGEEIFAQQCAACHGDFAEGVGNWPKLAGGEDTLDHDDPVKTVGSYWPYLSTTWDYINRSMPYGNAQSLDPDEVYAITAYILYSNFLVDEDFVLSDQTFFDVEMPNADGFFVDDRAKVEYPRWSVEPCMENCKDSVQVTMRAMILDVTPDTDAGTGADQADAADGQTQIATATPQAAPDPDLVAAGEKVFRKCQACHEVGDGADSRVGPMLNGIIGAPAGAVGGFEYSGALMAMAEEGLVWTPENLEAFLANPREFMEGTRMGFAGLRKEDELKAITAYLMSHPG